MSQIWPTQLKDIALAEQLIVGYAEANSGMLSLFELFVDLKEKQMDFRLAAWVTALVDHFKSLYGEEKGEWVARRIISYYIRDNQTLH